MKKITWLVLRLAMGLIFFWAFVDKLFGLGFATKSENAWINGGSPTSGFLLNATRGPLEALFKGLAGSTMLYLMYLAVLPPANNPFIDDHLIYILVLVVLAFKGSYRS